MVADVSSESSVSKLEQITQYSGNGHDSLFTRMYTQHGKDVYSMFEYDLRTAVITNEKGEVIFKQENVEVPREWSQLATNVVASRYFKRKNVKEEYGGNSEGSEQSAKRLIHRVSNTIRKWGEEGKYFNSREEAETFEDELTYLLLSQKIAFNSPVWFNLGLFHDYGIIENGGSFYWDRETDTIKLSKDSYSHPQISACFINSIGDYMFGDHGPDDHSIFNLIETEAKLFKYGSGNGTNFSLVRAQGEPLSGGGTSSGLMSFLKTLDMNANAVKSGGKTRRAAKMVILNSNHPDVDDFIYWKVDAERKARALAAFGYDSDMDGLYRDLLGQNSNNSIRVTDEFMKAVVDDNEIGLVEITTGKIREKVKARELFEYISKAAWVSGDPGLQYHTTINNWHTCLNTALINSSNPCSEYMFLDDTACNLASLNLMKFRNPDGSFNKEEFKQGVRVGISAQEILVDNAGYPTHAIAKNSHDYRPLGLGYANLGALIMSSGYPYDSEEAASITSAITAMVTGEAYKQSAKIASRIGPFKGFEKNREPFLRVMKQHHEHIKKISRQDYSLELILDSDQTWTEARNLIEQYGARNSQVTVLAPTGTIGFMMDCDTMGVEPDLALVKYKKLAGKAGTFKIVNQTVPMALKKLGYNEDQVKDIIQYIDKMDTIEGAPGFKDEHLPIFDCSFKPANGKRSILPMGHVRIMAAAQPFISGAISKTVNMPKEATPKDVHDVYFESWKKGLKAIALYRDGCKLSQPLNTGKAKNLENRLLRGEKRELPKTREGITIETKLIDEIGTERTIHIITSEYEDGTLGEIRIDIYGQGSTTQGLLDGFTVALSDGLKYGTPLEKLVSKHMRPKFEPSGNTDHPYIRTCTSIPNLVARIVGLEYLGVEKYLEITEEESIKSRVKDPSKLRINKNKDRLQYEAYLEEIKKIDRVMNLPINELDRKEDFAVQSNNNGKTNGNKISHGDTCPKCGFELPGKAGCIPCPNCFTQMGGGCPS